MLRDVKKWDVLWDRFLLICSIDFEDLFFNFLEDDEMDRINRKVLLGILF